MANQTVDEFISHYGVKGMRWGVRNAINRKRDKKWTKKINKRQETYDYRLHNKIADKYNAGIKEFNKNPKYDILDSPNATDRDRDLYFNDVSKWNDKIAREVVQELYGSSPSKNYKAILDTTSSPGNYLVRIVKTDVKHAEDILLEEVVIELIVNKNGRIVGAKKVKADLQQSDILVGDFLEHYGVKGMRWGVRTKKKRPSTKGYSKEAKAAVAIRNKAAKSQIRSKALTNAEINLFLNRMNLEARFNQATPTRGEKISSAIKQLLGLKKDVSISDVQKFAKSEQGKAIRQKLKKKA